MKRWWDQVATTEFIEGLGLGVLIGAGFMAVFMLAAQHWR